MGGFMTFWGNSDGSKHPWCIISHAAPHRKVFAEKNMIGPEWALKRSKLKAIVHAFRCPRTRAPNVVGCLERTWDGILKTPTTLNEHKNNFYDHFGIIPSLHDIILNGLFGGMMGQFRWCEAPRSPHPNREVYSLPLTNHYLNRQQ